MSKTVLITGASGLIGSHLREALAGKYTLRLLSDEAVPGEETIVATIEDIERLTEAFRGVDSVIHLAASAAVDSSWDEVLHNNLIGTYNVFEAARRSGVQQVIFASSNHAVGTYESELAEEAKRREHRIIDHLVPPRPDSLYGVSKVFGEALGRYYADHQGLRVICLRIGWITKTDAPQGKELADPETSMWQSQRDFAQLVEKCLEAPQVRYDVFYGVSNNPHGIFDLKHAHDVVGYVPEDSSAERNAS